MGRQLVLVHITLHLIKDHTLSGKQTAMTILARNKNEKEWIRLNSKKTDLQGYKNFFLENRIDHEIKKLVEYYINKGVNFNTVILQY